MEKRQEKKIKVKKQEEFMGIKLKHKVFVGGKRESSTPTTSWRIGLAQSDGSLVHVQNSNFPFINTLSARKLGANLKKTNTNIKAINMNNGDYGVSQSYYEKEKSVEHQSHMAEPPDETEEQVHFDIPCILLDCSCKYQDEIFYLVYWPLLICKRSFFSWGGGVYI